ncbi:unnamed protein product [Mesocestoides corti]|uniref:Uncharacterized protein n=1 Tax=Mesocestoides corti TaxID=53468 RepID=A0A0R3URA6_MESCO|nr:unnamed protein product [Mesocestoides corti]
MPQHYNVGLGGGVHGLSLPSAASLQQPPPSPLPPHTVGASTGDVERQKLRETLAKRMNQKKIAAAAQQHQQQRQQQSVSGTKAANVTAAAAANSASAVIFAIYAFTLHQRQPTRASQPSAPPIFLSGSSSRSGGGVGGDGVGGGSAWISGSPQQHSVSSSCIKSSARSLPSFESCFGMLSASRRSTSVQSPMASTSPPVVASLASRTVPASLCSPPVLPASSTAVGHHQHHHHERQAHPPAPPPPQCQPATTAASIMDSSLLPTPVNSSATSSAAGVEKAGFDPPVIFSRVACGGAGKERPLFFILWLGYSAMATSEGSDILDCAGLSQFCVPLRSKGMRGRRAALVLR